MCCCFGNPAFELVKFVARKLKKVSIPKNPTMLAQLLLHGCGSEVDECAEGAPRNAPP